MDLQPQSPEGIIMINPPYDERMKEKDSNEFYRMIGNQLKQRFHGYEAWILSANFEAMKHIGLKPSFRTELMNGNLNCKFHAYDLFKGKRADKLNQKKNRLNIFF